MPDENVLTARRSLDLLNFSPGQTFAVTGAAGAYGGYVIQLAKAEGLVVIADASEKDEPLVKSLGTDIVVRRGDDVATRIREYFPAGVDGLADGAVLNELVIPAVRDAEHLLHFEVLPANFREISDFSKPLFLKITADSTSLIVCAGKLKTVL